ncbi:MspI family type II restriction endonuclease [Lysinibacillus sp. KU-BSD001]|uniref:MspI family type II restriction endonuclease n=1 Tax=Lysinibacillus sp. KU-BSD001 TaxID=3141328 RepID=UPI0036EDEFE8
MESKLLPFLYQHYNIANLSYGLKTDKLGDVYEDFICEIFKSTSNVIDLLKSDCIEKDIIIELFQKIKIDPKKVTDIRASKDIPRRQSGGNPKTDVIVYVYLENDEILSVPISIKQTSARQVAFAEYDVETICREVGITDLRVKELMQKHQRDGSAKNFTRTEKQELKERLQPFAESLIRWTITMSADENPIGEEYPKWILKFQLTKETSEIINWHFYSIEEYIDYISLNRNGDRRSAGFGTGLSWTYATGTKGQKIQFKG